MITLLGDILFKNAVSLNLIINMNEIANNSLLAGDKFMLEIHLKQPGFIYSACGLFT